ncbi:MAG: sugar phosphate nucleotidyltransferase [Proteobacteria bacterium]|jgi:N-acetyl-alpha-D-muramate 1-phosphate uridylyltransferase|nr:sugar phosphate nucleotidyltransferase [Pseudomonadota bacterium]
MDVLILAAGLGTRMEELTQDLPKPLLPVQGKPLLEYAFNLVQPLKPNQIYVNTHYHAKLIDSYIKKNYENIHVSWEPEILGTGGGIKKIHQNDLLVLNTDNVWTSQFTQEIELAWQYFQNHQYIDNLLLTKRTSKSFDLEILPDESIQFPSNTCNAQFQGCYFIRQGVLREYPEKFNIPTYWKKCSMEKKLFSFTTTAENTHIGTKDLYLKYTN